LIIILSLRNNSRRNNRSRNQRAGAGKGKSECAGKVKSGCVEPCQWKSGEKRQYCAKKRSKTIKSATTKTSKVKPGLKKAYEYVGI
jgi:hypothetical protein